MLVIWASTSTLLIQWNFDMLVKSNQDAFGCWLVDLLNGEQAREQAWIEHCKKERQFRDRKRRAKAIKARLGKGR